MFFQEQSCNSWSLQHTPHSVREFLTQAPLKSHLRTVPPATRPTVATWWPRHDARLRKGSEALVPAAPTASGTGATAASSEVAETTTPRVAGSSEMKGEHPLPTKTLYLKPVSQGGGLAPPVSKPLGVAGDGGEGLPKKADSWPWPWTWGSTCVSHKLKHLRGSFWVPPMVAANSLSWLAQP